jgi:hypothetical protein
VQGPETLVANLCHRRTLQLHASMAANPNNNNNNTCLTPCMHPAALKGPRHMVAAACGYQVALCRVASTLHVSRMTTTHSLLAALLQPAGAHNTAWAAGGCHCVPLSSCKHTWQLCCHNSTSAAQNTPGGAATCFPTPGWSRHRLCCQHTGNTCYHATTTGGVCLGMREGVHYKCRMCIPVDAASCPWNDGTASPCASSAS